MTVFNAHFSRKKTLAMNFFYASLTPVGILFGLLLADGGIVGMHRANIEVIFSGLFFWVPFCLSAASEWWSIRTNNDDAESRLNYYWLVTIMLYKSLP